MAIIAAAMSDTAPLMAVRRAALHEHMSEPDLTFATLDPASASCRCKAIYTKELTVPWKLIADGNGAAEPDLIWGNARVEP